MHVKIKDLQTMAYADAWQAMKTFTESRTDDTVDELWCLEHSPVFTQGQAGKPEHILQAGDIPVIQTDRGGQVTYHGPGQLIIYLLLDVRRHQLDVKKLVCAIEQSIIDMLNDFAIQAARKEKAPGVYVDGRKICSLGLRIRKGFCYHGLALNVDMDLSPFARINPCGYAGMQVTQTADLNGPKTVKVAKEALLKHLCKQLHYTPDTVESEMLA